MSYKYDVYILLKEENRCELIDKVLNQGFEDEELITFNNRYVLHHPGSFASLNWNYVKWDEATDEVVQLIKEYIDMLNKNNIPFRYITIGEFGEVKDIKNYGTDPEDISLIASVYAKTSIYNGLKILN